MLEEGVELMHGRAMTAVLGNGKVEALQLASGAILRAPSTLRQSPLIEKPPPSVSPSTT